MAAALLGLAACKSSTMQMTHLPPIPDAAYAKGVSAPFCGLIGDTLVVAGGANFPDKPLLEGGAKRVYADIWAFDGAAWKHAGVLPDSTAYGASFSVPGALVFAGGNVCGVTTDKVYAVKADGSVQALPPLPEPMEQCGWSQEGDRLYLAGGIGSCAVYACTAGEYSWSRVASLPRPLVQPLLYARGGKLYLWGGFDPETLEVSSEGLLWDGNAWSPAPAIPDQGTFVGAAGAVLPDGLLAVVGGVNRAIFAKALHNGPEDRIPYLSQDPSWYQFRRQVFLFDGDSWSEAGSYECCALAGPGVAPFPGGLYVAGGELKPGVRSPRIFQLNF